jgi:hypothetical protein
MLVLSQSRLEVSSTHGTISCSTLIRWSFAGVGDCREPNFLSAMATTLRVSSWSWLISEAIPARGKGVSLSNVSGRGHRWKRSGSCPWRAIVRMEGGESTLASAIRRETRCSYATREEYGLRYLDQSEVVVSDGGVCQTFFGVVKAKGQGPLPATDGGPRRKKHLTKTAAKTSQQQGF